MGGRLLKKYLLEISGLLRFVRGLWASVVDWRVVRDFGILQWLERGDGWKKRRVEG